MKHHPFCPHCGYDLHLDQPVILNDFAMFGAGAPLVYKGLPLPQPLTPAEAAVVWTLLKACPDPVATPVILERVSDSESINVVNVLICRIRKKLRVAGAPEMIGRTVHRGKNCYVWQLGDQPRRRIAVELDLEAAE